MEDPEKNYQRVKKHRKLNRTKLNEYKGKSCERCSYDKSEAALEFHHIDPDKKKFTLSVNNMNRSWESIKNEADKCWLLCANCHREYHAGLWNSLVNN